MGVALNEGGFERLEGSGGDGIACISNEAEEEMQIMERKQPQSENFAGAEQVAEVGAGKSGDVGVSG